MHEYATNNLLTVGLGKKKTKINAAKDTARKVAANVSLHKLKREEISNKQRNKIGVEIKRLTA